MNTNGYIEIIKDGWRRTFTLENKPFPLGFTNNQLILPDNGELHSPQLLIHPIDPAANQYAVINVSNGLMHYHPYRLPPTPVQMLPYGQPQPLSYLDKVRFGAYELIFYGEQLSSLFEVAVNLPHGKLLARNAPLYGDITVTYRTENSYGHRSEPTQFNVKVFGLDPSLFHPGPSPETPFNVDSALKIPFKLCHPIQLNYPQSSYTTAGDQRVLFAVESSSHPQEWATVATLIEIQPFHMHKIELVF